MVVSSSFNWPSYIAFLTGRGRRMDDELLLASLVIGLHNGVSVGR